MTRFDITQYVIVDRSRLREGITDWIDPDDEDGQARILNAVDQIFEDNPTVYSRGQIAGSDATIRFLIIDALDRWIAEHGEISDDPDDIMSAATSVWTALGVDGEVTS